MSLLHPILRDLQSDISNLRKKRIQKPLNEKIGDSNPSVKTFCKTLEAVFQHGLVKEKAPGHYFVAIESLASEERRDQVGNHTHFQDKNSIGKPNKKEKNSFWSNLSDQSRSS